MSIALERGGGIGGSGFARGVKCFAPYEAAAEVEVAPPRVAVEDAVECSSSSIGRNSDSSAAAAAAAESAEGEGEGSGSDEGEEAEVQSSYKGPLDTMDALEDSLPIRRGISKFYCGKSKSFTSLADAISSSTSAKDLAKPENAYTRKRKNLLAFTITCEKSRNEDLIKMEGGGTAKKPANSSRSTLNPISRSSSGSNSSSSSSSSSSEEEREQPRRLPPRHPRGKLASNAAFTSAPQTFSVPMRSFSMIDLQGAAAAAAAAVSSSSSIGPKVKSKRN